MALLQSIPERLEVVYGGELSTDARAFRKQVLQLWMDPRLPARSQSIILLTAGLVLNGDWRVPNKLVHICRGCCVSKQHTLETCQKWLQRLYKTLRPSRLEKGKWASRWVPLTSSIHKLLPDLYAKAFGEVLSSEPSQTVDYWSRQGSLPETCLLVTASRKDLNNGGARFMEDALSLFSLSLS